MSEELKRMTKKQLIDLLRENVKNEQYSLSSKDIPFNKNKINEGKKEFQTS